MKDGARFVQASQLSLAGSGIATFSDRARDALRGGGAQDNGHALQQRQGGINGLHVDRDIHAQAADLGSAAKLMRSADGVRGPGRDAARLQAADLGRQREGAEPDRLRRPARRLRQTAGEVVNYVDNHDNRTLFDINALKLPQATSRDDRARVQVQVQVQVLGMAVIALSQRIAYIHAGIETLRSKSLDAEITAMRLARVCQSGLLLPLLLGQRVTNLAVVANNVLMSALLKHANMPARVVDGLRRNMLLPVVCAQVMGEYRVVLKWPQLGLHAADVHALLHLNGLRGGRAMPGDHGQHEAISRPAGCTDEHRARLG